MNALASPARRSAASPGDSKALLGIFVVSFVLFFLVAVIGSLAACPWRSWLPGAEGHKSLVGGVKSSVYTFMSYLT
jgi:light-harvesting complex 1 beta chain